MKKTLIFDLNDSDVQEAIMMFIGLKVGVDVAEISLAGYSMEGGNRVSRPIDEVHVRITHQVGEVM